MAAQSLKSKRDIDKLEAQMKVLSKRLVELEEFKKTAQPTLEGVKHQVNWLYNQVKTGMSEVLTNACQRIAREELTAEVVYDETDDEKLIKALEGEDKS